MALTTRKPTGAVPWPLVLIEGEAKAGKAQPLHARIATPTGWTTMGELTVGSRVIGADGKPTIVTGVYDRGERHIFRLIFSDGATAEACAEHLWATTTASDRHRRYNKGPKKGQPWFRPPVIRTTDELCELLLNGTAVHIPMTEPVEYDAAASLPLDPYALGLLLGDGGLSKPSYPGFTSGDPELFGTLAAAIPAGDTLTYSPDPTQVGIKGGRTTAALRELDLMGRKSEGKFIPSQYLTASVADRLAVLQGLMDTDGGMETRSVTFTSVSHQMASQLQELVHSLGGSCSMGSKIPSYRNSAGELVQGQTAYKLTMRLPADMCPFRLTRKMEAFGKVKTTKNKPPCRTLKEIEYVGAFQARCIAVDAPDHLYLTDSFIVTHNTWACAAFTASPRVGRTFWIDLGEGAADEYGAIPGADYEIVEHDGSFTALLANVREIREIGKKALADGEKPIVLVIDTMTEEWAILSDWAKDRARASKYNKRKLAEDPNADIKVSQNYWNDANARHKELMALLKKFPGIVLMTSHGKQVSVQDDNGQPVEGKKEHKVEAQKSLGGDATIWVRLFQAERGIIVGGRSVHLQFKPGEDEPRPLAKDWSLEAVIFDVFKCDPATAHVRNIADRKPDTVDPDVLRDEALKPDTTVARLKEMYTECIRAGMGDVEVTNERQAPELLRVLIARTGEARAAKAEPNSKPAVPHQAEPRDSGFKLATDDPWLESALGTRTLADVEKTRADLLETFAGKPEAEQRVKALLAVLDSRELMVRQPELVAS